MCTYGQQKVLFCSIKLTTEHLCGTYRVHSLPLPRYVFRKLSRKSTYLLVSHNEQQIPTNPQSVYFTYTKPQTHTEILTRPLDRNWCKWPFQNKRAVYYSTFLSFLAFQLEVINNYFKCESRSPVSDDPDDRPTITHAVLIEYTIAASALQLSNGKLQFSVLYIVSWRRDVLMGAIIGNG